MLYYTQLFKLLAEENETSSSVNKTGSDHLLSRLNQEGGVKRRLLVEGAFF